MDLQQHAISIRPGWGYCCETLAGLRQPPADAMFPRKTRARIERQSLRSLARRSARLSSSKNEAFLQFLPGFRGGPRSFTRAEPDRRGKRGAGEPRGIGTILQHVRKSFPLRRGPDGEARRKTT